MAARKGKKGDRLPRRLFKQERAPTMPRRSRVVRTPAGQEKMSEVLEEFVAPYRDQTDSEDAFRALLHLGMLAWNAAMLPEDERQDVVEELLREGFSSAPKKVQAEAREIVENLIRRKQEHFAANQRPIVSFELTDTGSEYRLFVASAV
jgi:hypothetical protein